MKTIIFNTKEEAENFSKNEAEKKGCAGVTDRWYSVVELVDGKWGIVMKQDDEARDANDAVIPTVTISDDLIKKETMYSIKK